MAASNPPEPFLEVEFEEATKYVRAKVAATGSQEDLLYLYARCGSFCDNDAISRQNRDCRNDAFSLQNRDCRFKQAKEGECMVAKPSFYQLTEKSKWNAWKELAGMGRAEAMNQYVEKVIVKLSLKKGRKTRKGP